MNKLMRAVTGGAVMEEAQGAGDEGGGGGGDVGELNGGGGDPGKGAGELNGGGGGGGEGGELNGGQGGGDAQAADAIDWDKLDDAGYMAKVQAPEGLEWNKDVMAKFAPLLRSEKIDPKTFAKFVALDAQITKEMEERQKSEYEKQTASARAAFKAAGEGFRKEFTPEQTKAMNETLAAIGDETFRTLVTKSPLSNSITMGKMLLAYREVYGRDDSVPAGGDAGRGERGFAEVWTGRKP